MQTLAIRPVTKIDRATNGNLLPEAKERTISQITDFLESKNSGNVKISEITRNFSIHRRTAEILLKEIANRWWQQDSVKLMAMRSSVIYLVEEYMRKVERDESHLNSDRILEVIWLLKELTSLDDKTPLDYSQKIAYHFRDFRTYKKSLR